MCLCSSSPWGGTVLFPTAYIWIHPGPSLVTGMTGNVMYAESWEKHLHISVHSLLGHDHENTASCPPSSWEAIVTQSGVASGMPVTWGVTNASWFPQALFHLCHHTHMSDLSQQPNSAQISWIPQTHELNKCLLVFAAKVRWFL